MIFKIVLFFRISKPSLTYLKFYVLRLILYSQALAKCLCLAFSQTAMRHTGTCSWAGFLARSEEVRTKPSLILSRRFAHVSCRDSSVAFSGPYRHRCLQCCPNVLPVYQSGHLRPFMVPHCSRIKSLVSKPPFPISAHRPLAMRPTTLTGPWHASPSGWNLQGPPLRFSWQTFSSHTLPPRSSLLPAACPRHVSLSSCVHARCSRCLSRLFSTV